MRCFAAVPAAEVGDDLRRAGDRVVHADASAGRLEDATVVGSRSKPIGSPTFGGAAIFVCW